MDRSLLSSRLKPEYETVTHPKPPLQEALKLLGDWAVELRNGIAEGFDRSASVLACTYRHE